MKPLIAVILLIAVAFSLGAQTTATVTASGLGQTQSVTFTLLPKSTVTLGFSSTSGQGLAGGILAVDLTMSTTRLQPASIQFTLTAPSASVASFSATTGATAIAAGKTITCAVPTSPAPPVGTTQVNCIVAGVNTNTIGNGIVAHVTITLGGSAPVGTVAVTLGNFLSSSAFARSMQTAVNPATFNITVNPTMTLACAANQIEPGEDVACTATVGTAVTVATTFNITTNTPGVPGLIVPTTVTIPVGSVSQTFTVTGQ